MELFVGTTGWHYSWNEDRSFDWYVANSGLNAVELNASFYRFPFPNMVKSWGRKGESLRWSIKVNRLITHMLKFSHILTWKEREWAIISLEQMEKIIETFLSEVAMATDEDVVRSRTFLIEELINWYGHYTDKINLSTYKANEIVRGLEIEIENLQRRSKELFNNLVKATKVTGLQVELSELQKARSDLNEVKQFLESLNSTEELEIMIKPLAGDKKAKDIIRKERLVTDVDMEMKTGGVRGDWTVAKYVLIKKQEEEIKNEINQLNTTLASLDTLSKELIDVTEGISKLFP